MKYSNYIFFAKYDIIVFFAFFPDDDEMIGDARRFSPTDAFVVGFFVLSLLLSLLLFEILFPDDVTLKKLFIVFRFVKAHFILFKQGGANASSMKELPVLPRDFLIFSNNFSVILSSDGKRTPTMRRLPIWARIIFRALFLPDVNCTLSSRAGSKNNVPGPFTSEHFWRRGARPFPISKLSESV